MKNYVSLSIAMLFSSLISCDSGSDEPGEPTVADDATAVVTYTESIEDFANPERGFYRYSETRASNYNTLNLSSLINNRGLTSSSGSDYQTYNTLVFRYFILDDFVDSPISDEFLNSMQEDFDIAREAGVKMIPRFTYTVISNAGDCGEGFICPPYGDAPKERVLEHIHQVGPVLTDNVDVILCIQMGFIGTWGENYYTDYFGDASSNADQGRLLDENWEDRIDVLEALLNAVPTELMVQVRYPQMKQRYLFGVNAPTTSPALTLSGAFTAMDASRIGYHNDCLFASAADFGTYVDYGNSSSPPTTDISTLKSYFADDSQFVIVGGETCFDGYSPQNDCAPAGMAEEDLRSLHYTYLNADYNNEVNNDWVDGGCMESIKQNMGYRLVLDSATFKNDLAASRSVDISLYLRNVGYASPVKDRPVHIVLLDDTSGTELEFPIDVDVRFWSDDVGLSTTIELPQDVSGEFSVYLRLPDAHESIQDRSEFAIRLANDDLWQEDTGYNDLMHTITTTN